MKTYKIVVALLAVFVFGVSLATSASAVTFRLGLWQRNGVNLTSQVPAQGSYEFLIEDNKLPVIGKAMVLCSAFLDGWNETNSLGWVSEVLTLPGMAVNQTPLAGTALECTDQENCEEPLVWSTNLGWETELEVFEKNSFTYFVNLRLPHAGGGNPGWEVECMKALIGKLVDECTTPEMVSELTLEGTTLLEDFSQEFTELAGDKDSSCSMGGSESGIIEGEGTDTLTEGGELTGETEEGLVS